MKGTVVSNKMQKTVVVSIQSLKAHPLYHKRIKSTKKIKAHTDQDLAVGQMVEIEQTKPIAGQVSFVVTKVFDSKEAK